jgi:hypothetical protein
MTLLLVLACTRAPALKYPEITQAILDRADANHDGRVDRGEYAGLALPDEPLEAYDRDKDGALDAAEVEGAFLDVDPAEMERRRQSRFMGAPPGGPRH